MIIVGQNRNCIVNFDNVFSLGTREFIKNCDGEQEIQVMAICGNGGCCVLAYYETEERAKEVLQEIVELYSRKELLIGDMAHKNVDYPKVYEMPEE